MLGVCAQQGVPEPLPEVPAGASLNGGGDSANSADCTCGVRLLSTALHGCPSCRILQHFGLHCFTLLC